MTGHFAFTGPRFTARKVAKIIGTALGRELAYQEANEFEDVDGSVKVTDRVEVQVGADYLVVSAWKDETTLETWPGRPNITSALNDIKAALDECSEPRL